MRQRLSRALLASLLLLTPVGRAEKADTTQTAAASRALLDVPVTNFDFGYAPQGSSISHVFWLKNVGGDTLHITDVRPGCGCTKAPLKKTVLPAGDSTDVEVIFSTGGYSSNVVKGARIISNTTGASPPLTFTAYPSNKLDSLFPYKIVPQRLDLDADRPSPGKEGWEYSVRVTNTTDHTCALAIVSAPDRLIHVELPQVVLKPGAEEAIRVRLEPGAADTTFAKSFTLEFASPDRMRYTLPVVKSTRWGPAAVPGQ
ncbi:MAG: DUF1573 domain-containing protein [Candidatus Zixiibacteriota bacterium]